MNYSAAQNMNFSSADESDSKYLKGDEISTVWRKYPHVHLEWNVV